MTSVSVCYEAQINRTYKLRAIMNFSLKQGKNEMFLCRGCLGSGRMYDIHKYGLEESYLMLGLKMSRSDGLPQHLYQTCSTLLIKYAKFREKCHKTIDYLKNIKNKQITENKSTNLGSYTVSEILIHSYVHQDSVEVKIDKHDDIKDLDEEIKKDFTCNNIEVGMVNDINLKCDAGNCDGKQTADDVGVITSDVYDTKSDDDISDMNCLFTKNTDNKTCIQEKKEKETSDGRILKKSKPPNTRREPFILSKEEGRQAFAKKYGVAIEVMTEEERRNDVNDKYSANNYPAKCMLCCKTFCSEELLRKHASEKHDATIISSRTAIAEHHRTHSGQTLTCSFCGFVCDKSKHYRLHLRREHPSELTWCCICGEVYINLGNHLNASHREVLITRHQCAICNTYFLNEQALEKHKQENRQADESCELKPCVHCGLSFVTQDLLREHFAKEHKKDSKKAESERRSWKRKDPTVSNLDGRIGAVCDVCGKIIYSRQGMKNHRLIHTGEMPHSCGDCGRKFRSKMSLVNHARIHSGERPFSCGLCQKTFSSQSGLYRHRRVHTGEKCHKCDVCFKLYSSSSTLKAHLKAVHMKMPHKYII